MRRKLYSVLRAAVSFCVGFSLLLTAAVLMLDKNMRRLLTERAAVAASARINSLLNETVYGIYSEGAAEYSTLTETVYSEGAVSSVSVKAGELNALKSRISVLLQEKLGELDSFTVSVPLGSVIGNEFTVGRGPSLPTRVFASGYAETRAISSFESAGVNQTLHRIILEISVNVYLVMPWYRTDTAVKTEFILAEGIIVGRVPDAYTVVIESESDLELGGIINDYGAQNYLTEGSD